MSRGSALEQIHKLPVAPRNLARRALSRNLAGSPSAFPTIDFEKAVVWCQQKTGKELAPSQREALKLALSSRALVITGGPGVGTMPVTGICRAA